MDESSTNQKNKNMNTNDTNEEKKEAYLEQHIFYGLQNLNSGFDAECILYFSETDFETVLNRVFEKGLGVYGIEPWQNGAFYDVVTFDDYQTDCTDPNWYLTAFNDFKERGEALDYAATYYVPDHLLDV